MVQKKPAVQVTFLNFLLASAALVMPATRSQASSDSYSCTAAHYRNLLGPDLSTPSSYSGEHALNFQVDRNDGRILGAAQFENRNASSVKVINRGDSAFSFKMVSVWSDIAEFSTLVIQEYITGRKKPFLFTDSWGTVITGTCE